jgi:type VI secretion system protein
MALRLSIISRHRQSLGERGIKEFGQNGGTIGRSLESDWVLPDGQRFLSSRHASIDYRSGSYYIIDTSTNGVYINGSDEPVGRGNPQRLFSNDRIRIGEYEVEVEIDELDSTREQMADTNHIDPVDLAMRVAPPDPTTYDLVDAYEITGVGLEMLLDEDDVETLNPKRPGAPLEITFESAPKPKPQPAPAARPAPSAANAGRKPAAAKPAEAKPAEAKSAEAKPAEAAPAVAQATVAKAPAARAATSNAAAARAPQPAAKSAAGTSTGARPAAPPPAAPQPQSPRPPPANAQAGLDAFFRGAGLEPQNLDGARAEQVLHTLGQVMREVIVGLTENLYLRAAQKATLKQPNTTIQPRGNNPLKFAAGVDEALDKLLLRESELYLSAVESIREAFGDIKLHQQTLVRALEPAIESYTARLDPEQLEQKLARGGRGGVLLNAANKLKYWDVFKDLYLVVTDHATGELPMQFVEDLAQSYETELAKAQPPGQQRKTG